MTHRRLARLAGAALAVVLGGCQPETRRVLVLDLGLTEPSALIGTAAPWIAAGYDVDYRRFYPHPTRADAAAYRVLLLLTGSAPEGPSDALRPSDLALLAAWVGEGGILVVGYAGDGEGSLDRWTLNRWLHALGTDIAIGDSVVRDTSAQPWLTPPPDGPVRGGGLLPFPAGSHHALTAPAGAVLARAADAPAMAGTRLGNGLVLVTSRHALAAWESETPTSTVPFLSGPDLERTRTFLKALARWTRRPAEWARVPPTRHGAAIDLSSPPRPLSSASPPDSAPAGAPVEPLAPLPVVERPALPAWTRRQGFRVLRDDQPMRPGVGPGARARILDTLVQFMEAGALTALWTRAGATPLADTTRSQQWERDVLRAAWKQMGERLQTTSVRWLPGVDLRDSRLPSDTVELDARGDTVSRWAALDPRLWDEAIRPATRAVARLAGEQQDLVPGLVLDLPSYGMGAGFAQPTFRVGLAAVPGDSAWKATLASLPPAARFDSLLERGYLAAFYAALEGAVAQRAATLRNDLRRLAPGRSFGLRVDRSAFDWFTAGLIRGLGDSTAAVWLFTDESRPGLLGGAVVAVLRLTPARVPLSSWGGLADVVFSQNGGFWLDEVGSPGAAQDSLTRLVRRLIPASRLPEPPARR